MVLLACCGALGAVPASATAQSQANPATEIDRMATASADVASGVALAREQAGLGDLVGAASTLERVLLTHPEADDARLRHAGLLCRLDDPDGARVEIAMLAGHTVSGAAWAEAVAACGPLPSSPEIAQ